MNPDPIIPFPQSSSPPARRRMLLPETDAAQSTAQAAALSAERRRIVEDSEALRVREANLREYEARIRNLQGEVASPTGRTVNPFGATAGRANTNPSIPPDTSLENAWQKLHRARAILEAEQANLRDDRLVMQSREADLKRREAAVLARERALAEREQEARPFPSAPAPAAGFAAAADDAPALPPATTPTRSAFARLTRGPFGLASSVLKGK